MNIMIKFKFSTTRPKAKDIALVFLKEEKGNFISKSRTGQQEIVLGGSNEKRLDHRKFFLLPRKVIKLAQSARIKKLAVVLSDFVFDQLKMSEKEIAEQLAINFEMANFDFVDYKTRPKDGWNFIQELTVIGKISSDLKTAFKKGQKIAEEVNDCRRLSNIPGSEMTPQLLAGVAEREAVGTGINVKVLGLKEIAELKMGGLLGVSQGSSEEPRFIVMEYDGGDSKEKPLVLIGKGITFDTGGLNLKPSDGIYQMHLDMSGGAAVLYSVLLAARLKLKKNIVGLIPAAENMISGSSYRPGDILKTMSGKTVEVLNTDAEGRLVLADALTYAGKFYKPRLVISVATLTGAALVALGQYASAIFSKDESLLKLLRNLGEKSGDYVWPLPLWEEFEKEMKGTFADLNNLGKSKYGGASQGAAFLAHFAKKYPWLHIDIAPRMTAGEGEYLAKGAVGAPVRLLIRFLETY